MRKRTILIQLLLSQQEMEYLRYCMAQEGGSQFRNGRQNLSAFVRERLMANIGYRSKSLQEQNAILGYELQKIGVNINQIARKLNAGFGRPEDVIDILSYLDSLEKLLQKYISETESLWRLDREEKSI